MSPHADVSTNVKYGYGLWLYPNGRAGCPADFEANGNGGQRIAVIPSKDMVVVVTGAGLNADDVVSLIAPAWRWNKPLVPNSQGGAKLAAAVAAAAAPSDVLMAARKPASTLTGTAVSNASPAAVAGAPAPTQPAPSDPTLSPAPPADAGAAGATQPASSVTTAAAAPAAGPAAPATTASASSATTASIAPAVAPSDASSLN
jgi:hypothetical protein